MGEDVMGDCERLYSLMRRFWLRVNPKLKDELLQGQLNMPQYSALVALEDLGETTMGALARELQLTMGAVTNLVDRVVSAGYAERWRDQSDRRVVRVKITPTGLGMLQERSTGFCDYAAGVLSQISPGDRELFLSIYTRIVELTEADAARGTDAPGEAPSADTAE